MTDPTTLPLDQQTYKLIVETAANVQNLKDSVGEIKIDVSALKDGVSGLKQDVAVCLTQDEAIAGLKEDVDKLKESANKTAGKLVGVAFVVTLIANYLAPIMPALFGVKS